MIAAQLRSLQPQLAKPLLSFQRMHVALHSSTVVANSVFGVWRHMQLPRPQEIQLETQAEEDASTRFEGWRLRWRHPKPRNDII
jgi:hypothetical protein